MIDRSIPYNNLILKCTKICRTPVLLPKGYSFKMYDVGDEKYCAKLEYEIGDFSSVEEAEMYFKTNYFNQIDELKTCSYKDTLCGCWRYTVPRC